MNRKKKDKNNFVKARHEESAKNKPKKHFFSLFLTHTLVQSAKKGRDRSNRELSCIYVRADDHTLHDSYMLENEH